MKNILAVTVALLNVLSAASAAPAEVAFDWVNVLNAGNAADSQTLRGAVPYNYAIATTEVTNAQYTEFLNAVDPNGLNQRGLYNTSMDENFGGAHIFNDGTVNGARYRVNSGYENYPVSLVSWFSAV